MHDASTLPNGPTLSAAERAEWLRRGADAVPALRSFIRDHEASANDDYARAHAVDLLVDLGGPEELPDLGDSSTIEELRALLPNLAEMQLFGFLARELGRMSEAVAFARECERIAVRTAGPARESAIAATKHPELAERVVSFYEALAAGTARS